jgi:L-alanine-DL-glutamate epimerase-like enolase superfamily enzyme
MIITRLRTEVVKLPLAKPIPSGRMTIQSIDCILVFLETDQGATGEGLVFTLNGHRLPVLHAMLQSLEPLVVGMDPGDSGAFWARANADVGFLGHAGVTMVGLAGLDMAMWDLKGKSAGCNVASLLGRCHASLPMYRSGGLRLSSTIDELQREAADFRAQGFRAMKMSLGKADPREDRARVKAVREAIGFETALMTDCNQQFTAPQAIRLGRMLEEFQLAWIEEPVPYHDHYASAQVAAALDTPVASGENEYTRRGIADMVRAGSADILMPDLQRMGGPTELLKVAHYAELQGIAMSLHLFSEMSLSLAAAMPNVKYLEFMPWFSRLYAEALAPDANGHAAVPTASGWGYAFDPEAVARFRV